jgi:hypothetical protein
LAARGRGRDWRSREAARSLPRGTLVTPYCKRTRPGRGTNMKAAGFPPLSRPSPAAFFPPSRSASRRSIWAGARGDISLVGPGTTRSRNADKMLVSAGVIREVTYPEWLANTVMVKKANGKWRMCIDFTDLKKACPKDEFPLPRIDSLVDATATSELMSLLDCYSGYHQIWMKKEDKSKTSFITPSGTYCYL